MIASSPGCSPLELLLCRRMDGCLDGKAPIFRCKLLKKGMTWRRERDSNPRYGCPYTRSPGVRLQPLCHPSMPVFLGAAEGSERPPDAQCGAARMDELSFINERPVGPPGRAAYDFRSGPARAMTCISPSAPAIATL